MKQRSKRVKALLLVFTTLTIAAEAFTWEKIVTDYEKVFKG